MVNMGFGDSGNDLIKTSTCQRWQIQPENDLDMTK